MLQKARIFGLGGLQTAVKQIATVPPDIPQDRVTFWDAFLPEQICDDHNKCNKCITDMTSVRVSDTSDNSEWRVTKPPLDSYAAIRNLKSVGLTLSVAHVYSSCNDMLLPGIMHKLFNLYIAVRAHYLVVTCITKFSVLRAASLQFCIACADLQWAVRQLEQSWSCTISSTRCGGYTPQWTHEVDNNTDAFERVRTFGSDVSM